MKRRTLLKRSAVLATPAVAGCAGDGGGGGGEATTEADAAKTIELTGNAFEPQIVKIDTGEMVEWTNREDVEHTVTSTEFSSKGESWELDETLSSSGDTATHTFEEEGIHEYYCTVHGEETMCGVVLAGQVFNMVGYEPTLPCAEEETTTAGDETTTESGGSDGE